jgi:hypothetical protein
MNLVRGVNCGAKILLAHFRLICKGHVPFRKDFDWKSKNNKSMALLKDGEMAFVAKYIEKVQEKCKPAIWQCQRDSWLISQGLNSNRPA